MCEIRIEVPKDKDGKKKKRQLKVAEKTSVSRNNDDTRNQTLSAEKGVKVPGVKISGSQPCQPGRQAAFL